MTDKPSFYPLPEQGSLPAVTLDDKPLWQPAGAWGGARPGGGRKPGFITLLKRAHMAEIKSNTEYALALFSEVMRDETLDLRVRLEAGKEVLDRALGKPAQVTRPAEKEEFKNYLEKIEKAVNDSRMERPDARGAARGQADEFSFDPLSPE